MFTGCVLSHLASFNAPFFTSTSRDSVYCCHVHHMSCFICLVVWYDLSRSNEMVVVTVGGYILLGWYNLYPKTWLSSRKCSLSRGVTLQGDEDDDEVMFSCRLDNAKAITTILSCLSHGNRKDQQAQCEVNQSMSRLYNGANMNCLAFRARNCWESHHRALPRDPLVPPNPTTSAMAAPTIVK